MRSRELAAPAILNAAQIAANAIEVRDGTTVVTSGVAVIRVCGRGAVFVATKGGAVVNALAATWDLKDLVLPLWVRMV